MPVKATAISKRSKDKCLLRDVSFEINPGEVLGVFGPAGSGKKTLLRVLARLEKPDTGQWLYNGHDLFNAPTAKRETHYAAPAEKNGLRRAFAGLFPPNRSEPDHADLLIDQARSSNVPILLFVENFCHLTQGQKDSEFESLRRLAVEKQKFVLYATSNFEDIFLFCDRVLVMSSGKVLQSGTPEEVYLKPVTSVVARLTGRTNIFEARRLTSSKADVPEFQSIEGSHRLTVGKTEKTKLGAPNKNVRLVIRPEHISISFGASFPEDNLLKAVVTSVKFLGPGTLVTLDANGMRIDALVMRLVGLNSGDECMIGLPPDRIMVFAD